MKYFEKQKGNETLILAEDASGNYSTTKPKEKKTMMILPIQAVSRDLRFAQFDMCEAYGVDLYADSANNVFAVHENFENIPAQRFRASTIVQIPAGWVKIDAQAAKGLEWPSGKTLGRSEKLADVLGL